MLHRSARMVTLEGQDDPATNRGNVTEFDPLLRTTMTSVFCALGFRDERRHPTVKDHCTSRHSRVMIAGRGREEPARRAGQRSSRRSVSSSTNRNFLRSATRRSTAKNRHEAPLSSATLPGCDITNLSTASRRRRLWCEVGELGSPLADALQRAKCLGSHGTSFFYEDPIGKLSLMLVHGFKRIASAPCLQSTRGTRY